MKKIILALMQSSLCLIFLNLNAFISLKDISKYSKKLPEYPEIDNTNYLNPDYTSFYKKTTSNFLPTSLNKALDFMHIKKVLWSSEKFAALLKKVTEHQEKNLYKNEYIIKITPKNKTNFVIWGDIQGAFHSLKRTLIKLKADGIIDEQLKITKPDCYFVFNGNAIGNSPYIMETLTIILTLMDKNPGNIFYIKGDYESKENWKNFGLQKELKFKAKHISKSSIPLENEINSFLNTLPSAVYIRIPSDNVPKFIRISYFDRSYQPLDEISFAGSLQKATPDLIQIIDPLKKETGPQISIEAIIEGKDRSLQYQKTDGLQLLLPDKGATAWSMLSSPTLTFQKIYDFYNDAFVILSVDPNEKNYFITLHKQHAVKQKGFDTKTYNVLSEELIKEEIAKTEKRIKTKGEKIVIGSSLDLAGLATLAPKQVYEGINAYIQKVNASGGVNGKEIQFIALNDQYNPELALKNINTFLDDYKTNIILVIGGTPTTKAVLPKIQSKEILVAFPHSGAAIFRKPDLTNLIHMRTSYSAEVLELMDYTFNNLKIKRFAIFYQDDDFGLEGLNSVKKFLQSKGIKDLQAEPYQKESTDFNKIVSNIEAFNPQGIIFFAAESYILELIAKFNINWLLQKKLFTLSFMSTEFEAKLNKKGLKITNTYTVPNPQDQNTEIEIVKEYQKSMGFAGKSIASVNPASLNGYIYAAVFVELLKRISGEITKEKIIEQAEKIKNENFKGLTLNFDPETRELFKDIWINTEDNEWIYKKKALPSITVSKKRDIKIGTNLDLTSVMAVDSKPTLEGISVAIREENATGKINNIKLVTYDNKFQTSLIQEYTKQILNEGIDIFFQPTGSAIVEKMLPLIQDKPVFMFCGATAPMFRKAELKNFVNYFPSSVQSANILTEYLIKNLKKKRIAVVYQLEPFGKGAYEGCLEIFKKHNLKENDNWIGIGHLPEEIADPKIYDTIKEFKPDAIILATYFAALKELISKLGVDFLFNIQLGIIEISTEIKDFLSKRKINFVSTTLAPDSNTSDIELLKEYKDEKASQQSIEGYIGANILLYIINKIDGEVTPQKLLQAAESIKNETYKGLSLSFNEQTRTIFNSVWIGVGDGIPYIYKEKEEIDKKAEEKIKKQIDIQEKEQIKKVEPTEKKREIRMGANQDLSGVLGPVTKPTLDGILSRFQEENMVNKNTKFNLTYYDNKMQTNIIATNTEKILNAGIDIILHPTGSVILEKMLPMIQNKPLVIFCGATAPMFRKPELTNFVNYLASSEQSARVLTEYLIKELNKKKFAIVYQKEPYSEGAYQGSLEIFKKYNLKKDIDWIELGHFIEEIDDQKIAASIKSFNPEVILQYSFDAALKSLVNRLGVGWFYNKLIAEIEFSEDIKEFIQKRNIKYVSTEIVPDPKTSDLEIAGQFREKLKSRTLEYGEREMEGYIIASIIIHLIDKIEGKVTPEKIIAQAEKLKYENFFGLTLNFDPKTRSIFNDVWIDYGEGKTILYKESKIEPKDETKTATATKEVKDNETTKNESQKITPKTIEPQKTESELKVGLTIDRDGKAFNAIKSITIGLKTRISKENQKGGINGKKINLIVRDDQFNPELAKENIEKFLSEDKTDIILSPAGSLPFNGILPFIKEQKIGVFFPGATCPEIQISEYKNLINLYASSSQEGKIILDYIVNKLKLKKLAIFGEEEPFSQGAINGAKEILLKSGLKEETDYKLFTQKMQTGKSNIEAIKNFTESIQKFDPEAIILLSLPSITRAMILNFPRDFLASKKLFGISTLLDVKSIIKERGLKFTSTQLVPDPINSQLEIVKEYRKEMSEKGFPLNTFSLEGYITATIFIELIKKISGDVTKEKIIEEAEKTKDYQIQGLTLNFQPETRNLLGYVWLYSGDDEVSVYKAETSA